MNLSSVVSGTLVAVVWIATQSAPPPDLTAALAQAEARWQQQRPTSYEFSVEVRCFCPGLLQRPVAFRVTGTTARALEELQPPSLRVYDYYNTVEKLFEAIRRSVAAGQYKSTVEYDALGFPSKAVLNPRERVADDELFFRVSGFRKIQAPMKSGLLSKPLQPSGERGG